MCKKKTGLCLLLAAACWWGGLAPAVAAPAGQGSIAGLSSARYVPLEETDNPDFFLYRNPHLGYSAYVPKCFDSTFPLAQGEGCRFLNQEGCGMGVSGRRNRDGATIGEEYRKALQRKANVEYHSCGDDWYVISYVSDGDLIYYEKVFLNEEYYNELYICYPRSLAEQYNPLVEVIEANFVPSWKG